jgi:hypothetical protein
MDKHTHTHTHTHAQEKMALPFSDVRVVDFERFAVMMNTALDEQHGATSSRQQQQAHTHKLMPRVRETLRYVGILPTRTSESGIIIYPLSLSHTTIRDSPARAVTA